MAHKYLVMVTAGDDGYIVAECPALPGCVSQGMTREEALRNIQEAIEGIIEVRKAQKLPIPSPDIVEISVAAQMASLPVISGLYAAKAFEKIGFILHRQRGSHMILYHPNGRHLSVPDHKELDRGTLRALIRGAGITVEEFVALL